MSTYPTGVESHGGSLRLWSIYQGKRVRENLGVPDTAKNRKLAGELRSSGCYAIKTSVFNYAAQFPQSVNLAKFGFVTTGITLGEVAKRWLELKRMEISLNAISRYTSYIKVATEILGPERLISSIAHEDILTTRKELLTGHQICGKYQKTRCAKKRRTVRTVNVYIACLSGLFEFVARNGYVGKSP